jgi:cytochrome c peroxidase
MRETASIRRIVFFAGLAMAAMSAAAAAMSPAQQSVYDKYAEAAKKADPAFNGFSPDKGRAFFHAKHTGGKPDSPSCTSCHTENLKGLGKTRAGKDIQPMAASANPKRFTDPADVEKWFSRNCPDVLGRECTVTEKGEVLAYLLSQ